MSAPDRRRSPAWVLYPLLVLGGALVAVLAYLGGRRRGKAAASDAVPAAPAPTAHHHQPEGWLAGITRLSLHRRPVVFLAAGVVALAGAYSAFDIQQELFPDIDFPAVTVITRYPGASPESTVEQVTAPIQAAISNVDGL